MPIAVSCRTSRHLGICTPANKPSSGRIYEYEPNGRGYCEVCGCEVDLPCLACLLRSQGRMGTDSVRATDLDYRLQDSDAERLEEVRATWRANPREAAKTRMDNLSAREEHGPLVMPDMERCFIVDEMEVI